MTRTPRVPDAPANAVPPLLAEPPWTRPSRTAEPVVLKLKASKEQTTVRWAPGMREEWLNPEGGHFGAEPLPDGTDWDALAETFASGEALGLDPADRYRAFIALVMQAPPELGKRLLADDRYRDVEDRFDKAYHDDFRKYAAWRDYAYSSYKLYRGAAARHELDAYGFVLHAAKNRSLFHGLEPFLDAKVAQVMIKHVGAYGNGDRVRTWYALHGTDAARLTVPAALRKPGPTRERAEEALRLVAGEHGHGAVVEAARHHGDEAADAIAALRTDPLDLYPDPLPAVPAELDPERLPQVLLRGREHALPASATRHFLTLLAIAHVQPSYPGYRPVVDALDPESLAGFACAVFVADRYPGQWASPAAQTALLQFGDDRAADLVAPIAKRWDNWDTWNRGGTNVLRLFTRLGTPTALRHLHMLSEKAADQKRLRPFAKSALKRIADERGYTPEQLADRLVPDFGLDAEGTLTLDYGRRRFTVGFDEHLKPFVTDGEGKVRKTLPKPGVKDDDTLAPAAHQRFAGLKKEVRTVAAEQIKRLERAMVAGRSWTPEEFRTLFAEHPLLRHVTRRLVWSAGPDAFRVAEDGTFADAADDAFVPSPDAAITLPHPLRLPDLDAWTEVFADYAVLQPFEQLARPVHRLTDGERASTRFGRYSGATVHFGRITGMTSRGWELGDKEDGGFRRQVMHMTGDGRHVMVFFSPGIRVYAPEELAEQEIRDVIVLPGRYSGKPMPWGDLDPVAASEIVNDLTRLTS
ncbi:DUF4132 domain-containing protein [Actinomadura sp. WMMB 499]|uniref:DUF4132 domain-containing protein n=1 Tax=Actinomadura sp. WMMB 499 TaxID=1219491 RepID=UPI001246F8A9|nr:DUF4132 domain-containing protein [Actinomadura sp. WMMB 499]QFG23947.1 DUF4132 domain-containing protein [Actinomadura sp. WMMB 499]